jgi:hypothetical protein
MPASAASCVSGLTPTTTRDNVHRSCDRAAALGRRFDTKSLAGTVNLLDRGAREHLDSVAGQLVVDERAKFRVDGRKHLGQLFHLRYREPAGSERLGHLEADVAGADDQRALGRPGLEGPHELKRVADRVEQVNAVRDAKRIATAKPVDCGLDRSSAGADDQRVVFHHLFLTLRVCDEQFAAVRVDAMCGRVQMESHSGRFEGREVAMSKVAPVRDVSRDVVGDPADGEVRVGVVEHDVDVAFIVELANAEGGADARVAAANDDDPTQSRSGSGAGSARINW